jgi:hypothetical protein
MPRCHETKPDGTPCERIVPVSQEYCYSHDPARVEERRRNASKGGRGRPNGEIGDLKKRLKELAADVLAGKVERGDAAVVNQIWGTLVRAIEQERKLVETGKLAERLEAMEEVLKGRKGA